MYLYVNIQYHRNYVHTHVHIWITHLHHTTTPLILVTFPSLKMTTSGDEDIPALDNVGY